MRLALLLLIVGCKGEPTHVGSCQSLPTSCEEYSSKDAKYVERQKGGCAKPALWSAAACPTENRVGACVEEHSGWRRTKVFYQPVDEKTKTECGAYGTWVSR
jgi:hypothetical protein